MINLLLEQSKDTASWQVLQPLCVKDHGGCYGAFKFEIAIIKATPVIP